MNKLKKAISTSLNIVVDKFNVANDAVNLPNKLTILRILLMPLFVVLLLSDSVEETSHHLLFALIVFAVASITDFLDGYIARTRMMVTNLGKFLDPIADKILVMGALICFAGKGWIASWVVVVILTRDSIVSAVRLAAVESSEKIVIPARTSGKVKTIITMVTVCAILALWMLENYGLITNEIVINELSETIWNRPDMLLVPIGNALMYVCTALTVFSGVQYVSDARDVLKNVFKS